MSFGPIHNFFDIQPGSKVASPQPAYQKGSSNAPLSLQDIGVLSDTIELEPSTPGKKQNDTQAVGTPKPTPIAAQIPPTPNELEMSRPSTPNQDEGFGVMRTWNSPPMTKWRILCCCLIYFQQGANDSGMSKFNHILHSPISTGLH